MKEKYIPYKTIKEYIKILEIKINESSWNPDLILSINRGGCVPGVFLSHKMGIRHEVYSFDYNRAVSYTHLTLPTNREV